MSFTEDPGPLSKGINRRDLIKKGAIAGAIVWTVPLIESVPAYAATGSTITSNCSYFVLVYTVTVGTTTNLYADRIGSDGSCHGNTLSNDVDWCYQCTVNGTVYNFDSLGASNTIRSNGTVISSSGCAANTYFTVNGNTITPKTSSVQILFAVVAAGSLNSSTGQVPNAVSNGACTTTPLTTKINVACGPLSSATFDCLPNG